MADLLWLNDAADGEAPISAVEILNSRRESHTINGTPIIRVQVEVLTAEVISFIERLLKIYAPYPLNDSYKFIYRATDADIIYQEGKVSLHEGNEVIYYQDYALVNITYTALPGIVDRNAGPPIEYFYHEEDREPRSEFIQIPKDNIVWGTIDHSVPASPADPVLPEECPVKSLGGASLVRRIRGYDVYDSDWDALIGTVNTADYTSSHDGNVYAAGTLMLRSVNAVKGSNNYSFVSPATPMIITRYEYKPEGWDVWWRNKQGAAGYYDMRYANSLATQVVTFPVADHSPFLF